MIRSNMRYTLLFFLFLTISFHSCIKEKETNLGDDPLNLRIETDADGKQILRWNPIKLSNFREYAVQVASDSSFFNTTIDTSIFEVEQSQVRLNLDRFPLATQQYFRLILNNKAGSSLISETIVVTNDDLINIDISTNINQIMIDPSSKYLVLSGVNSLACIDLDTKQISGGVTTNQTNSQSKFSFSTQNGIDYFHHISYGGDPKVHTYLLPDFVLRDIVQLNLGYEFKFLALDNSNLYVHRSAGWPHSMQLINSATGDIISEVQTDSQQSSGEYQSYFLTDAANKEFIHYRPDSLIKYRVTQNNKLEKGIAVLNAFPSIANDPVVQQHVLHQRKEPTHFAPSRSQGIYSDDLQNAFSNPSQLIALQNFVHYSTISKDGKYVYSLYQKLSNNQFFVQQYSIENQKIEQEKSIGFFFNIQSPFLIERPDGIYFTAISSGYLNLLKLDI